MADKGDTYYCSWRRESDGTCVGWEIRRPALRAEGSSPDDMSQALGDVVGEHYNDHEAALHFDPSLSDAGDPTWFSDGLIEIAWNASFKFRPTARTAYANGRCKRCGSGLGSRTPISLHVDEITEVADGAASPGSNEPPPCDGMPGSLMIVSEEFLGALASEERQTFESRPVSWATKRRRHFFERIPHVSIKLGAVKGMEVYGLRCDLCDRRVYSHGANLGLGKVVCRKDIPPDSSGFFFAGDETEVSLFCTSERWNTLAGKKWARKLTGDPLAVIDVGQFDSDPLLGTLDEIAEFRRMHGFRVPFRPKPAK
jgi:hypothetical protein